MINKLLFTALLFVFTSNVSSQVPNYLPTNGLVGYWPFNGNANDESGNGNNGTVNGATLTTDRFGMTDKAYSFDGLDDIILINNIANVNSNWSINFWYNSTNSSTFEMQNIIGIGQSPASFGGGGFSINGGISPGQCPIFNSNPNTMVLTDASQECGQLLFSNSYVNNNWYNVSIVCTNGNYLIFINGISNVNGVLSNLIPSQLYFGNRANINWQYFKGEIDDVGIWNRALTQQEITNLFTSSLPPTCSVSASDTTICSGETVSLSVSSSLTSNTSPCVSTDLPINLQSGLVGYWPFCGNANDVSGNGNNGTLQGNINYQSDRFGNANSAIKFNNTSDLMCTSNSFSNPNIFTISIWVKSLPNSLGDNLVGFNNGQCSHGGSWDRVLYLGETEFGFYTYNGFNNYLNGNGSYKDGNWHHYVVTLSNSGRKVYIDGQLLIQDNTTTGQNYSGFWRIGGLSPNDANNSSASFFDDFIIYDRELSLAEITQLYNFNLNSNTYLWSNGATTPTTSVSPTATATYSCTVTNNGDSCTDDVTILVDTPPTPTITPSGSTSICAGGNVTLTSSSATGNAWATGETTQSIVVSTAGNYGVTVTNTSGCSALSLNTTVNVNALPTVNAGIDQAVCAGTTVTLSGTGTNTYSWDNGVIDGVLFTPAANTTYTLTGTNTSTGCTNTDQVDVTVNALPTINAGIDQTVCAGTAVTLSGTGANTYSWDNSVIDGVLFTPSADATYIVTGTNTATGCTNTDQVDVTVNALPTINAGIDQTVCAGTTVTLSGTGADTYSWDNAVTDGLQFTPTANITYTVTGINTSTGCTNTDQVDVTVNALPTINAGIDQTVCAGTTVTLSGTGADTYSWDNAVTDGLQFTPTANITYTVTGINTVTGCTNTDQVTVTVNALPTVNAGNDQTICAGTSVTLSGTGADTYSWDNAVIDGISFVPTATEIYHLQGTDLNGCQGIDSVQVIVNNTSTSTLTETALDSYTLNGQTYTQSGTYSQVIPNAAGCDSTITLNLTLNFTGIDEMKDFAVSIYPNPSRDVLFIHSEIELFSSFELIDNQGRIVLSDKLNGNQTSVNLEAIAPGNYYLKIQEINLLVKVVKQ
jgi:hypothetical protein